MQNNENKPGKLKTPRKVRSNVPIIYIIIIGSLISFACFFTIRKRETSNLIKEFERLSQNHSAAIQITINEKIRILESIQHFFKASVRVERDEFAEFVKPFLNAPSLRAYGWLPRVKDRDRKQFESNAKALGLENFRIYERNENGESVPASNRKEYYPLFYAEPSEQNLQFLGLDYASMPDRLAAMDIACKGDKPAATARIPIGPLSDKYGIIIFLPVYRKALPSESVEERNDNLEGFVIGFIKIDELVEKALELTTIKGLEMQIFDLDAPKDKSFLDDYNHPINTNLPLNENLNMIPEGLHKTVKISAADRHWAIECTPTTELISLIRTPLPWVMLITGYTLTSLLVVYIVINNRRTAAIEKLVEIRTEELNTELTERKKIQKEREVLHRAVEIKNKELQSILYIASHDLRSPLVNIMGFGEELALSCQDLKKLIAKDSKEDDDYKMIDELLDTNIPESIGYINSGSNKINMLIDGLLQVSRAGSVALNIGPINMNKLLKDISESLSFQMRECGAEITIDDLPPCIGDEPAVNQVFSNLIGNALKYLDPDRKGRIHVTAKTENKSCTYCVRDNGIGIPRQYTEKIFELFHRINPDDKAGGEGLGLTIVTRILDRLNGTISLDSQEGKGSKFYVTLPKEN